MQLSHSVHLVIASGGNAGLAAACVAQAARVRCTVYIPTGMHEAVKTGLEDAGARVIVQGKNYDEALAAAKAHVDREPEA